MAIPAGLCRIVLHGTSPHGEIWETGFWMSGTGVASAEEANALAQIVTETCNASDGSGAMRITFADLCNAATNFIGGRVYAYPAGGPHAQFIGTYDLPTPRAGGVGGGGPDELALCMTLRTGFAGRTNRGRMYLPLTGPAYISDGQVDATPLAAVTEAWASCFTDINASDTGKIVVLSQHLGTFHQVSSVKIDSRTDVQRRRSNREIILRQHQALVAI